MEKVADCKYIGSINGKFNKNIKSGISMMKELL